MYGAICATSCTVSKKSGYKWSINLLLAAIGLATAARIWFDSYIALILTSFVAGVAIAVISPMINAFIKARFPHRLAPVIGLYSLVTGAGATISAGFTGVFFEKFNSWQIALDLWGLLTIIAIILWTFAAGGKEEVAENIEEDGDVRNPWKNKTA